MSKKPTLTQRMDSLTRDFDQLSSAINVLSVELANQTKINDVRATDDMQAYQQLHSKIDTVFASVIDKLSTKVDNLCIDRNQFASITAKLVKRLNAQSDRLQSCEGVTSANTANIARVARLCRLSKTRLVT